MYHDFTYRAVLASAERASWRIEDVVGPAQALDFSRHFLPENLARTAALPFLSEDERRILSQIRGHEYLRMFGIVEEFILPFVLDHARPLLDQDDDRVRALLQFASEEAKHIQLFRRFQDMFALGFGHDCAMIGPASAIGAQILSHDPLAVALVILHIEWMTQRHYVECVRDDRGVDPLFASLLKHHWMEEAQHARIDTLMVEALADGGDQARIDRAIDDYCAIGLLLDEGLRAQAVLNCDAFERAAGRNLDVEARVDFLSRQHQAARWTFLGSGMTHPKFRATLGHISAAALDRVDAIAPLFC